MQTDPFISFKRAQKVHFSPLFVITVDLLLLTLQHQNCLQKTITRQNSSLPTLAHTSTRFGICWRSKIQDQGKISAGIQLCSVHVAQNVLNDVFPLSASKFNQIHNSNFFFHFVCVLVSVYQSRLAQAGAP